VAMEIYPISAIVLFCIIGRALAFNYQAIRVQIEQLRSSRKFRPDVVDSYVYRWQYVHAVIDKAGKSFNSAFEVVLLSTVSCTFIGAIVNSIYVYLSATDRQLEMTTMTTFYLTIYVFHLSAIGSVADQIRLEVCSNLNSLSFHGLMFLKFQALRVNKALRELKISSKEVIDPTIK
jgi:hypothetical protein